jgi:hypothetical protein
LTTPALALALGDLKLVKAKDHQAFAMLASAELERGVELAPASEVCMQHRFQLELNSPISEKTKSPYLLYGNSEATSELGQLPLTVNPHKHLRAIFDTLTTVFSFLPKGETSKNGWTAAKLKPPESRSMSFVDELNLSARFVEEALEISYLFSVKKFDASLTKVGVRKDKTEVKQSWARSEYLFGGEFVRQEFVEASVQKALSEVASGFATPR